MKLYIWDRVFCDYTAGVAFAMAPTLQEAYEAVKHSYCSPTHPQYDHIIRHCGHFEDDGCLIDGQSASEHGETTGHHIYGGG